jgi:hypothetical protein
MSDTNHITEQLKKVASDVLSEEVLQEIETAFTESVKSKAEDITSLRVEKALLEQDEEHAVKLEKLLEAIDKDHTQKLERVVTSIDKNHSSKLKSLIEKFRKEIDSDANVFKEGLVDNISNYLDLYVEKALPEEEIKEAVKNKHAMQILENLRKSLSIDSIMANEQVRDAVIDGKKQIDEATTTIKQLKDQNKILSITLGEKEANLTLDTLTEGLPASKKRHMHKMFEGKSKQFISENFKYTLEMFEKSEKDKLETLKEQATVNKKVADRPVTETKKVVQESVEKQIEQTDPSQDLQDRKLFDNYMGELTRW